MMHEAGTQSISTDPIYSLRGLAECLPLDEVTRAHKRGKQTDFTHALFFLKPKDQN